MSRAPRDLAAASATALSGPVVAGTATTVHLVRHGESSWNRLGRVQGQSPLAGGLTPRGWSQAKAVAGQLEQLTLAGSGRPAPVVITSDLLRARQTAEVIASALGTATALHTGLREQHLGGLEGRLLDSALDGTTPRQILAQLWQDENARPPGEGETIGELTARASATLAELVARAAGRTLVLVAHGRLTQSLLLAISGSADPDAPALPPPLANASLTTLFVGENGRALSMGSAGRHT